MVYIHTGLILIDTIPETRDSLPDYHEATDFAHNMAISCGDDAIDVYNVSDYIDNVFEFGRDEGPYDCQRPITVKWADPYTNPAPEKIEEIIIIDFDLADVMPHGYVDPLQIAYALYRISPDLERIVPDYVISHSVAHIGTAAIAIKD